MSDRVAIIGIGWSGFRPVTPEYSYKELMYEAARRAYSDAGVDPRRDIESFVTVAEDFHEGTSIFDEYTPDQLGAVLKPMHTITGDGLHGLATAYMLIKTGQFSLVAVEGHSKASNLLTPDGVTAYAQDPVLNRPLRMNTHFVGGMEMNRYLYESGSTQEQCAQVVVKNRSNALENPSAPFGADLSVEDILSGPPLSWPLGVRETAEHADGAIVMVLASEEKAKVLSETPVWILGAGWSNDSPGLENRDWSSANYTKNAAKMAYRQAGIYHPYQTIDFAEVSDIYAYKELQSLEELGFFQFGEAGLVTEEGLTHKDGDFPVNVSGGCLGMGNLLDANGLARALEIVLQLRGTAGPRQLEGINVGLAHSWRGVPTASGAVMIMSN
ncbi:MAG: acetyl-CoA acetyltransferase [Chloroflexota bacterium]|nr:MAG: acetyl-CoA acetyltransferase [Chloroflexota bacterium]